jgi:hypothetical protein
MVVPFPSPFFSSAAKKRKEEGEGSLFAVVAFFAALQLSCNSAQEEEGDGSAVAFFAALQVSCSLAKEEEGEEEEEEETLIRYAALLEHNDASSNKTNTKKVSILLDRGHVGFVGAWVPLRLQPLELLLGFQPLELPLRLQPLELSLRL